MVVSATTRPRLGWLVMLTVRVSPSSWSMSFPRTAKVVAVSSSVAGGMSKTATGRSFTSSTVMSNVAMAVAVYSSSAVTVTLYLSWSS